jgi:hypothetical protein
MLNSVCVLEWGGKRDPRAGERVPFSPSFSGPKLVPLRPRTTAADMEKKAIVKSADMEESMQQDAIDCAAQVCVAECRIGPTRERGRRSSASRPGTRRCRRRRRQPHGSALATCPGSGWTGRAAVGAVRASAAQTCFSPGQGGDNRSLSPDPLGTAARGTRPPSAPGAAALRCAAPRQAGSCGSGTARRTPAGGRRRRAPPHATRAGHGFFSGPTLHRPAHRPTTPFPSRAGHGAVQHREGHCSM